MGESYMTSYLGLPIFNASSTPTWLQDWNNTMQILDGAYNKGTYSFKPLNVRMHVPTMPGSQLPSASGWGGVLTAYDVGAAIVLSGFLACQSTAITNGPIFASVEGDMLDTVYKPPGKSATFDATLINVAPNPTTAANTVSKAVLWCVYHDDINETKLLFSTENFTITNGFAVVTLPLILPKFKKEEA